MPRYHLFPDAGALPLEPAGGFATSLAPPPATAQQSLLDWFASQTFGPGVNGMAAFGSFGGPLGVGAAGGAAVGAGPAGLLPGGRGLTRADTFGGPSGSLLPTVRCALRGPARGRGPAWERSRALVAVAGLLCGSSCSLLCACMPAL